MSDIKHPTELSNPSRCPKCGGKSWTKKPCPFREHQQEDWQCSTCGMWLYDLAEMDAPRQTRNIETEWQRFEKLTIPPEAGADQRHDQHMAFLGGALTVMHLIGTSTDDEALKILEHLQNQCDAAIAANKILAMFHEKKGSTG